jgi:hypothetical protein
VLWFSLWFLIILKIPILYLAYVIWWSVKDPPLPGAGADGAAGEAGGGPGWSRGPRRGRGGGPHGSPARRPAPRVVALGRRKAAR